MILESNQTARGASSGFEENNDVETNSRWRFLFCENIINDIHLQLFFPSMKGFG